MRLPSYVSKLDKDTHVAYTFGVFLTVWVGTLHALSALPSCNLTSS